jgi:preprotein translocase subunit SecY
MWWLLIIGLVLLAPLTLAAILIVVLVRRGRAGIPLRRSRTELPPLPSSLGRDPAAGK